MRAPLFALLAAATTLGGCGAREEPAQTQNDSRRQEAEIVRQAEALDAEVESNVSMYEQALENETAIIFENRGNLLNESAANSSAAMNAVR